MVPVAQMEKAARFAKMHDAGCFVLANAWNPASAALIVEAGFPALATTSAGVANAEGLPDGEALGRDRMIEIAGAMARRFPVPTTADLEAGYGPSPADVAETIRHAIDVGLVGCNIEDSDPVTHALFHFDISVARIAAGVEAARKAGLSDFVLNARVDTWISRFGTAEENFAEAVRRANAYLAVGARCTFVFGPTDSETIGRLTASINGPLNIGTNVGSAFSPSLDELRRLGVRRASMGGAIMYASYGAARQVLERVKEGGTFEHAAESVSFGEMNRLFEKYPDAPV